MADLLQSVTNKDEFFHYESDLYDDGSVEFFVYTLDGEHEIFNHSLNIADWEIILPTLQTLLIKHKSEDE